MSPEYKIKYAILADVFAGNDKEISSTLSEEDIEDREKELNKLFDEGEISQKEWALLWAQALEDYESYPEDEVLS